MARSLTDVLRLASQRSVRTAVQAAPSIHEATVIAVSEDGKTATVRFDGPDGPEAMVQITAPVQVGQRVTVARTGTTWTVTGVIGAPEPAYVEEIRTDLGTVREDAEQALDRVQGMLTVEGKLKPELIDLTGVSSFVKQPSPPEDTDLLWFDTSQTPPRGHLWDGTAWVPVSEDVQAELDAVNNRIDGLTGPGGDVTVAIHAATTTSELVLKAYADTVSGQAKAEALADAEAYADAKPGQYHSTTTPSGVRPVGTIWYRHGKTDPITGAILPSGHTLSDPVIGQWVRVASGWASMALTGLILTQLNAATIVVGTMSALRLDVVELAGLEAFLEALVARKVQVIDEDGVVTVVLDGSADQLVQIGTPGAMAVIDSMGRVAATRVDATDSLVYRGQELDSFLHQDARLVAIGGAGAFTGAGRMVDGAEIGIFDVKWHHPYRKGRWYRVECKIQTYPAGGADKDFYAGIRVAWEGADPQVDSPQVQGQWLGRMSGTVWDHKHVTWWITPSNTAMGIVGDNTRPRLLLTANSDGPIYVHRNTTLAIYDDGPSIPFTSTPNPGGGAATIPSRPVEAYSASYIAAWHQNYNQNGTIYNASSPQHAYQGRSPNYTTGGSKRSLIGFVGSVASDVGSGTITGMELEIRAGHWHLGSGGTGYLVAHGHTSAPGTYSENAVPVSVGHFGRNDLRRVAIPSSWWAYFKTGAFRGIGFRVPGDGIAAVDYGYFSPQSAVLHVTYER